MQKYKGDYTRVDILTPALIEVLQLVADGLSNKEIAFERGKSIYTIRAQLGEILRITDSRNRVEAVRYYWENLKECI